MRKLGMGLVVLAGLAVTAEANTHKITFNSSGVLGTFDYIEGCVERSGTFFTSTSDEGPYGVIIVLATDHCHTDEYGAPITGGQWAYGPVSYTSNGLQSATVSGTLDTVVSSSSFEPVTYEFSLSFAGTGGTILDKMHSSWGTPGEYTALDFSVSRRRAATVSGSLTATEIIEEEPVTTSLSLTDAVLGSGVSGTLYMNH